MSTLFIQTPTPNKTVKNKLLHSAYIVPTIASVILVYFKVFSWHTIPTAFLASWICSSIGYCDAKKETLDCAKAFIILPILVSTMLSFIGFSITILDDTRFAQVTLVFALSSVWGFCIGMLSFLNNLFEYLQGRTPITKQLRTVSLTLMKDERTFLA